MYQDAPPNLINIAATVKNTQFLGPGNRAVFWVRGCYANCPGCIAPDWQSPMPENFRTVDSLVDELIVNNQDITGITISGGEPFLQAIAVAQFIREARKIKPFLTVIVYSGFKLEVLQKNTVPSSVELLSLSDVLIDGRYVKQLNEDHGLFGSSNQRVHYLTDALKKFDFNHQERKVEFRYERGELFMIGVPSQSLASAYNTAVDNARSEISSAIIESVPEVDYERE